MFLLIYRLTRNSPAPPLYPLTFLVQQSSSGTDAISLPSAVYLASPSQPPAVLVQRSTSSCTVSLQPAAQHQLLLSLTLQLSVSSDASASSLSSIAFAASRRPCPAIHQQLKVSLQPAAQHQLLLSLTLKLSVSSDAVAALTLFLFRKQYIQHRLRSFSPSLSSYPAAVLGLFPSSQQSIQDRHHSLSLSARVQRSSGTTSIVSLLEAALLQQPMVITGNSQVWRCEKSIAGNQFLRALRFTPRESEKSYVLCMNV